MGACPTKVLLCVALLMSQGAVFASGTEPSPPPGNDARDAAEPLRYLPRSVQLITRDATVEPDEPSACGTLHKTVWYEWTAPGPGLLTAHTLGSTYDTVLGVYAVDGSGGLEAVACDDDSGNTLQSEVVFLAVGGTRYLFQVGAYSEWAGRLAFHVRCEGCDPGVRNDDAADAIEIARTPFRHPVALDRATRAADEPVECAATGGTVWYRITPETPSAITARAEGDGAPATVAVYTGSGPGDLHAVGCAETLLQFEGAAGVTYHIQVTGSSAKDVGLDCDPACIPPSAMPQDDFRDAAPVNPLLDSPIRRSTVGATVEADEPLSCAPLGATVWYRVTATEGAAGLVHAHTIGSGFDTVLAVYEGTAPHDLALVACSDDFLGEGWLSRVSFVTVPGRSYFIQAGGYNGAAGDLVLHVEAAVSLSR